MSDLSTISILFEEIKQFVKQILSSLEKLEKSNNNARDDSNLSTPDLTEITNQVSQLEELMLSKLDQIEQNQAAPKKVYHRISINIASSWVFLTIIGLSLFLITSLCLCYKLKKGNDRLTDNDLKYRYIKMQGETSSENLTKLETVFTYERDNDSILVIRKRVETYECLVKEQAEKIEQARLNATEAERLQKEVESVKGK